MISREDIAHITTALQYADEIGDYTVEIDLHRARKLLRLARLDLDTSTARQSAPYAGHPPAVRGSATSEAASASVKPDRRLLWQRVLDAIEAAGPRGCTTDELEAALVLSHQTCSPRVVELRQAGLIEDSGLTRKTRSGRLAVVYVLTRGQRSLAL